MQEDDANKMWTNRLWLLNLAFGVVCSAIAIVGAMTQTWAIVPINTIAGLVNLALGFRKTDKTALTKD